MEGNAYLRYKVDKLMKERHEFNQKIQDLEAKVESQEKRIEYLETCIQNLQDRHKVIPVDTVEEDGDMETEEAVDTSQTDEDKRRVRRTLRDLHDKLLQCKDGYVSKSFEIECLIFLLSLFYRNSEDFSNILTEANQILKDVKGTQEAMEDAKMFLMLCLKVRNMLEDTNTNEKKFHVDEFAANIGRFVNANVDRGNNVRITRPQLVSLGKKVAGKFRRTPNFNFILGALDTEAPEEKERRNARRQAVADRQKAVTKTAIVEPSQVDGQMTDKLVASTRLDFKFSFVCVQCLSSYNRREILNKEYRSNGKKPVNYFEFVLDPDSFRE